MCHEAAKHCEVHVWGIPGCERCELVKKALTDRGCQVIEKDLFKLKSGVEPNIDALAAFAMSGEYVPLVCMDGRFLEPDEIDGLIGAKEDVQS